MKKKTPEEFLGQVKKQNPDVVILSNYVNSSTKVKVRYKKCGHEREVIPYVLLQRHGCAVCANNTRKSQKQFEEEIHKINPSIEVVGQYTNALTPIQIRCSLCGYTWSAKPVRLSRGFQCMNCVRPHTSFMEQFILLTFKEVVGEDKVFGRNRTAIGKELDIYIPEYKYAVEPGTWLYHKNKIESDSMKRKLCADKEIRLITVYDTFPQGERPPFDKDCYVYEGFLNEAGYERLIKLVIILLQDIKFDNICVDWKDIADRAYLKCHWDAHKEFSDKLQTVMPEIEILEQYKGNNIPILVNKKSCNHPAWRTRPCTLLKGVSCPLCGIEITAEKRTKTQEEFVEEVRKIHPSIKVLGKYTKTTERILVECEVCGKQWEPLCYGLLQGKGCPHCSAIKGGRTSNGKTATKDTEQFKKQMAERNPNIEILGEYVNNKTKLAVKCLICGYIWNVVPQSIYNGHGCPKCAKRKGRKK